MRSLPIALALAFLLCIPLVAQAEPAAAQAEATAAPGTEKKTEQQPSDARPDYTTERIRGKVVWLAEAVKRIYGVPTDPDFAEALVAIETEDGQLVPLLKDARGRGFMLDERLRNKRMELLVRRYEGLPLVQAITVYTLHDGKKYELDYWCDICAIAMYELKECECCQGPIRLREREVGPSDPAASAEK